MPLSQSGLSSLIQSELKASSSVSVVDDAGFQDWADRMAAAIVNHITANAVVTVAVTSGSSAGTYIGTVS